MEITSLPINGYHNQPIRNTFIHQSSQADHLGIILPGYAYSADMASLYFAGQILLERGADLLRVEYAYNQTDFLKQPDSERNQWLSADVQSACQVGLAQHSYRSITLVGKSLGTLAMGHLLTDPRFHSATCVWQTPLLATEWLRLRIREVKPPSLFIIGTADKNYRSAYLAELEIATRGRSLVLEGADHGLEIPGSVSQSFSVLAQIVESLQKFL